MPDHVSKLDDHVSKLDDHVSKLDDHVNKLDDAIFAKPNSKSINGHIKIEKNLSSGDTRPDKNIKPPISKEIFETNNQNVQNASLNSKDSSCNENHPVFQDLCIEVDNVALSLSEVTLSESIPKDIIASTASDPLAITYVEYESELQMADIMRLITKDLSEPYSIYTYRYFIHNWPKLCFLAMDGDKCIGSIVCKLDVHKCIYMRGYIAMLAVDEAYRGRGIGSHLVIKAIKTMIDNNCDEVVLETEITNTAAIYLYENLGFVRDKRLFRYYLNGVDALRLKLWLR